MCVIDLVCSINLQQEVASIVTERALCRVDLVAIDHLFHSEFTVVEARTFDGERNVVEPVVHHGSGDCRLVDRRKVTRVRQHELREVRVLLHEARNVERAVGLGEPAPALGVLEPGHAGPRDLGEPDLESRRVDHVIEHAFVQQHAVVAEKSRHHACHRLADVRVHGL